MFYPMSVYCQTKQLFGPLVIQLEWCILKQLFASVSVNVVNIFDYSLPLRFIIAKYSSFFLSFLFFIRV